MKGYPWRIGVIIDTPHPVCLSDGGLYEGVPVEDLGNNRHPSPCMSVCLTEVYMTQGYPWRIGVIIDTPHPVCLSDGGLYEGVPVEDRGNNRHPSPCMSV